MKITKFGHACLLIEEGGARLLIDPGAFSRGFEGERNLDAVLITHEHQDHVVAETLKELLDENSDAVVYADERSAQVLEEAGVEAKVVHAGDEFEVAGVKVAVIGSDHAQIHPDIPGIPNVGYLVARRFFYPGDALTDPKVAVEVLAAPSVAPWMSVAEAIDYLRLVKPKIAIPIHDAITTAPGMYNGLLAQMTQGQGTEIRVMENGSSTEV